MKTKINKTKQFFSYTADEAALQKAWHGTNFLGSLSNVKASEALKRVSAKRHNIWELAVHSAYWKFRVIQRIKKDKDLKFPLKGTNWFKSPTTLSAKEWKEIRNLARTMHTRLQKTISELKENELMRRRENSKYTNWQLVVAIALHDVYHTGQIQLLKRLIRSS